MAKKNGSNSDIVELHIPGYDAEATAGDCIFDHAAALRAVEFFPTFFTHVKGTKAGEPFYLDDWQVAIVATMFGWKRPDGSRRYRTVYIEVPRKNGKSTLASGIALFLLFGDGEPGAEVYSAAADRDQAAIVFDMAKHMVLNDEVLRQHSRVMRRSIVLEAMSSSYKVISADSRTAHGFNASGVIFDELHAQRDRDLWDALTTSTGSRNQPMVVAITTAGYDQESICWEVHDYASRVRDGIIDDDTLLPVIYAASGDDGWLEESTWRKANPGLGSSLSIDFLRREFARAASLPGFENTAKRLYLNLWTEQAARWLPMDRWDEMADESIDEQSLLGRRCYAGLDLSTTTDLSALVLVFPDEGGGYSVLPYFWLPQENAIEREHRDHVPYVAWSRDGHLETTEGNVIDYDVIRKRIGELGEKFDIAEIAIDRWNATQLATQLADDGFTVAMFGQGYRSMNPPSKELEGLVLGGRLAHSQNPVLRWCASNVAIETDAAGNIKPSKKRSSERIDGIVALVMAIGRAIVSDGDDGTSIYDDRGLITL